MSQRPACEEATEAHPQRQRTSEAGSQYYLAAELRRPRVGCLFGVNFVRLFSITIGLLVAVAEVPPVDAVDSGARACPEPTAVTFFFPAGTFHPRPDLDAFVAKWYSKHLAVMQEPSLSCGTLAGRETYRFTWLRTFHHPVVVRVNWLHDGGEISSVELDGAGGYEPGSILKSNKRVLSRVDWDALKAAIQRAEFWAMPTQAPADLDGADGAQWILEGRRGDQYHIVDRWSPESGPYHEASLLFLSAAGIKIKPDEVY